MEEYLQKIGLVDPVKAREFAQDVVTFKAMLNLPTPEEMETRGTPVLTNKEYIEYLKGRFEFFRKNENYDILTFKFPVAIADLIPKGRNLTVEQIVELNPHLTMEIVEKVPANTPIVMPKFDLAPSFWNFLKSEARSEIARNHPFFYGVVDSFGPLIFDPLSYPFVWIQSTRLAGTLGMKVLKLEPAIRIAQKVGQLKTAERLREIGLFNQQLMRFIWPGSIPSGEWAAKAGVSSLVSAKQAVLSFSVVKLLPPRVQKAVTTINNFLRGDLDKTLTMNEVNAAIMDIAKKNPKIAKKIADDLNDWIIGVVVKPSDRAAKVLNKLGLPPSELWRLMETEPRVRSVIEIFVKKIDEAHEGTAFRSRFYNRQYQRSSSNAQAYFNSYYQLEPLKKGDKIDKVTVLLKDETPVEAWKRIDAFWAQPNRIATKDLARGRVLVNNWLKETESWALLERLTVSRIKIPAQFEWKEAISWKEKRLLKGEKSALATIGGNRIYFYDKNRFHAGTGEILQDFLSKTIAPKLDNFSDIQIYAVGNSYSETKLIPTGGLTKAGKPAMDKAIITKTETVPSNFVDTLITDFYDPKKGTYYLWTRENKNWFLDFKKSQRLAKDEVVDVYVGVSYRKYNPKTAKYELIYDLDEEIARVPIKTERIKFIGTETGEIKKITLDRNAIEYIQEAAALDWYRWNNPSMFFDFKAKLDAIPIKLLTPRQELQKFIMNLPDNQRVTSYQRLLLQGDILTDAQRTEIWNRVKELSEITAEHYKDALIKHQLGILKQRGVSETEILSKKRELWKTESTIELRESGANKELDILNRNVGIGLNTIEVQSALSVKYIYVPYQSLQGDALMIYIRDKVQRPLAESYKKFLADIEGKDAKTIIKVLKGSEADFQIPFKNIKAIGTLPTDSSIISKVLKDQIRKESKDGWIFKVADITPKDKALIKFMKNEKIPYQKIDVKPIQEGKFMRSEEITKHIETLGLKGQANPNNIFTEEGSVRILSQKLYRPQVRIPPEKPPYMRVPEDAKKIAIWNAQRIRYENTMKDYYGRLDQYRVILSEEMRKTEFGRELLKKIEAYRNKEVAMIRIPEVAITEIEAAKVTGRAPKSFKALAGEVERIERGIWEDLIITLDNQSMFIRDSLGISRLNPVIKNRRLVGVFPVTDFKEHRLVQEVLVRGTRGIPLGTWAPEISQRFITKVLPRIPFNGMNFVDDFAIAFQMDRFSSADDFGRYLQKLKTPNAEELLLGKLRTDLNNTMVQFGNAQKRVTTLRKLPQTPEVKKEINNLLKAQDSLRKEISTTTTQVSQLEKKLVLSKDSVENFLVQMGAEKTALLPEERATIEFILGGSPIEKDLIFQIEKAISEAQEVVVNRLKILRVPPGKTIVDDAIIEANVKIRRLEALKRIIPDWQIARKYNIRLTTEEWWQASKGNILPEVEN
ncbi:MAG: hypothetical protein KJ587_20065, partial [Alphaproteobacteria bacterium]|nr:hypothetical protein [Alphaproteobacteria bacterium]